MAYKLGVVYVSEIDLQQYLEVPDHNCNFVGTNWQVQLVYECRNLGPIVVTGNHIDQVTWTDCNQLTGNCYLNSPCTRHHRTIDMSRKPKFIAALVIIREHVAIFVWMGCRWWWRVFVRFTLRWNVTVVHEVEPRVLRLEGEFGPDCEFFRSGHFTLDIVRNWECKFSVSCEKKWNSIQFPYALFFISASL